MGGRLRAMWTEFWRFVDAVQDGVTDFFGDWRRNHLIAAPLGILLTTLYMWQFGNHQLTIDRAASLVDLGALVYGAIISGTEVVAEMFYAIAKRLEYKDKLRDEGRKALAERLQSMALPEEEAMLKNLLDRVEKDSNGQGTK